MKNNPLTIAGNKWIANSTGFLEALDFQCVENPIFGIRTYSRQSRTIVSFGWAMRRNWCLLAVNKAFEHRPTTNGCG
jgi:hypothetical protein